MKRRFRAADFLRPGLFAAMAILLATSCAVASAPLAAAAAATYPLSRIGADNRGRAVCAALLLLAAAAFAWGALIAVCLLTGALLVEAWLADSRASRIARLLSAALALKVILFVVVPGVSPHLQDINGNLPVAALLCAAAVGAEIFPRRARTAARTDPLLVALLTAVLLSCALATAVLSVGIAYPNAILLVTSGACILLTAAAILSAPFTGSRPSLLAVSHAFSLQVPLEQWVARISAHAASNAAVHDFTDAALREFIKLPGVFGVSWRLNEGELRVIGEAHRQSLDLHCPPLFMRLHTRRRASPWEWFNYYLLARITSEYCLAKQREERNRADNLSRAVYETGSRLTHDIKNILHALAALTQLTNADLIKRQLPVLRERLENTLRKLQTPSGDERTAGDGRAAGRTAAGGSEPLSATEWWEDAKRRHAHQPVEFSGGAAGTLPAALFDLALDNFIGNALIKRQLRPALVIRALLSDEEDGAVLRVVDDGDAAPPDKAAALFVMPVASNSGFGVALYQIGVEAAKQQYLASLENNTAGEVVFTLRRRRVGE